jgi:hypothetical protein
MTVLPIDLATAFHSFPRRLEEALAPVADDPEYAASVQVTDLTGRIDGLVAEAAAVMGVAPAGSLAETSQAVARAIEARPNKAWDKATIDRLKASADGIGATLREITRHLDEGA